MGLIKEKYIYLFNNKQNFIMTGLQYGLGSSN